MIEYLFVILAAVFLSAAVYWKTNGGKKMVFMKKSAEDRLAEARKLVEEARKAEEAKEQQKQEQPIVETNSAIHKPAPEDIKEIEAQVQYYANNYRGIFNPNELQSEIACLLFGCLCELKKIKEKLS